MNNSTWTIEYHDRIKKQLKKLRSGKGSTEKKVKSLIQKISVNPFYYGDNLEQLYTYGQGYYSRKTSRGGRLVYEVNKTTQKIFVISLSGHYNDNGNY